MNQSVKLLMAFTIGMGLLGTPLMAQETLTTYSNVAADINGDGLSEHIYLKGDVKLSQLIIKDSTQKKVLVCQSFGRGYDGKGILKIADFDGDGIKDLMVQLSHKGKDGLHVCSIYSFINNKLNVLKAIDQSDIQSNLPAEQINVQPIFLSDESYIEIRASGVEEVYTLNLSSMGYLDFTYLFRVAWQHKAYDVSDEDQEGQRALVVIVPIEGKGYVYDRKTKGNLRGWEKLGDIKAHYIYQNGGWKMKSYQVASAYPIVPNVGELVPAELNTGHVTKEKLKAFFNMTYGQMTRKYGENGSWADDNWITDDVWGDGYRFKNSDIYCFFGKGKTLYKQVDALLMEPSKEYQSSILGIKLGMTGEEVEKIADGWRCIKDEKHVNGKFVCYDVDEEHEIYLVYGRDQKLNYVVLLRKEVSLF